MPTRKRLFPAQSLEFHNDRTACRKQARLFRSLPWLRHKAAESLQVSSVNFSESDKREAESQQSPRPAILPRPHKSKKPVEDSSPTALAAALRVSTWPLLRTKATRTPPPPAKPATGKLVQSDECGRRKLRRRLGPALRPSDPSQHAIQIPIHDRQPQSLPTTARHAPDRADFFRCAQRRPETRLLANFRQRPDLAPPPDSKS